MAAQRSALDLPPPPGHRALSRQGLVTRPHLFERLSAASAGEVTVVSGPPGSGKTVLVGSWLEAMGLSDRVAWVSIERGERDAQRFWLSVIDALAGLAGGDELVARVSPAPGFREELVIERLLVDLESLEDPAVLVIDDLHELDSAEAHRRLERFLGHLEGTLLRVVLVTRGHQGVGLHRLRLDGRLSELGARDLRFTLEETRALLAGAGVRLTDAGLALLHERTEGWAAGLRLAAISLAESPDPERFVREFSGSERTVAGYLLAEVLERQPPEVRDLLLRTSILERVSGPLADALTGGTSAERTLQELEDAGAFVTALNVGRSWFRYHHLFADLLRLELRRRDPMLLGPLHRAAARWFEQHGEVVAAVRHAQAAEDWPDAARVVAQNCLGLILDGRSATLRALLAGFPRDAGASYPELAAALAKSRLHEGLLDESAAYIAVAERAMRTAGGEPARPLALPLAEVRLALARRRGALDTVLAETSAVEAALEAQPSADGAANSELRAAALLNLGIAELFSLRLDDARRDLGLALTLARRIDRPYLEIGCLGHLGIAAPFSHEPVAAGLALTEQAIRLAEAHGWGDDPVAAVAYATRGVSLVWLGRFAEAEEALRCAQRALRPDGEPGTELIVHHARGLLQLTRGRPDEALAAFRVALRMQALLAGEHPLTHELRNRVLQAQARMGDTAAVRAALARVGTAAHARADMRISAATLALAEDDPRAAVRELGPVIERTAPVLHPRWAAIEASLLDAKARERLGERQAAEASLERALELAEPEGIILPFALWPMREQLERHRGHRTAHATLLTTILDVLGGSAPPRGAPALREPLSDAELRVVRYLPSNLKAAEIAGELFVSSNTVRTHVRHIYAKLDAHSRSEAVSRARELGLLAPTGVRAERGP